MSRGAEYSLLDSLQNLRIRVRLERLAAGDTGTATNFNQFIATHTRNLSSSLQGRVDSRGAPSLGDSISARPEADEYTFKWQEKLFNEVEFEKYATAENCVGAVQEQYHKKVLELREPGGRRTARLFSYVEGDDYTEGRKFKSSDNTDEPSDVPAVRRRRSVAPLTHLRHPVTDHPKPISLTAARHSAKTMYIMAGSGDNERRLCTITVINNTRMIISPDFTSRKPYKVESPIGVFQYTIHNDTSVALPSASQQISMAAPPPPTLLGGGDFDTPMGAHSMLILAEIVDAWGFEYPGICVQYVLDTPPGWYNHNESGGVTPSCSSSPAKFGHPIEWMLSLNPVGWGSALPHWPQIFLCVMSLDGNVHRTEGYACVSLPTCAGVHSVTVDTWRPIESRVDQLRRHFVGGSPELSHLECMRATRGEEIHSSRLGLSTVASGKVRLRFRVIEQGQTTRSQGKDVHGNQMLIKAMRGMPVHSSIIAVLEAFRKARQRMLAVRENIPTM